MEAHARVQSSVSMCSKFMRCSSALRMPCLRCVHAITMLCLLHGVPVRDMKMYGLQVPAAARDRLNPATSPSLAAEFEKVQLSPSYNPLLGLLALSGMHLYP